MTTCQSRRLVGADVLDVGTGAGMAFIAVPGVSCELTASAADLVDQTGICEGFLQ